MRAVSTLASGARHLTGVAAQAILIAAIIALVALFLSPVYRPATWIAGTEQAAAARLGSISVTFDGSTAQLTEATSGSIFSASGCGFRAGSDDYYMVVYGPTMYSSSLGYWVDAFPVGRDGCGTAAVSWSSSGVPGAFDVWVARSPSGNPWQAQPSSNVVRVTITNP
jgi:hypothetical protein